MGKLKKAPRKKTPFTTSPSLQSHPTREELHAMGKSLRSKCPRHLHAAWQPPDRRPDPPGIDRGVGQGTHPATRPGPPRPHVAVAVYLLSRGGAQHGRGPGIDPHDRDPSPGVRRLSPAELRGLRDP